MRTWTQLELAWELDRAGVKVPVIAQRVGKHRATVYRWLKGMRQGGLFGCTARLLLSRVIIEFSRSPDFEPQYVVALGFQDSCLQISHRPHPESLGGIPKRQLPIGPHILWRLPFPQPRDQEPQRRCQVVPLVLNVVDPSLDLLQSRPRRQLYCNLSCQVLVVSISEIHQQFRNSRNRVCLF